jgi:hypothetical protein
MRPISRENRDFPSFMLTTPISRFLSKAIVHMAFLDLTTCKVIPRRLKLHMEDPDVLNGICQDAQRVVWDAGRKSSRHHVADPQNIFVQPRRLPHGVHSQRSQLAFGDHAALDDDCLVRHCRLAGT